MTYDHGPLVPYEVIWRSGHIETVHAHQVILPPDDSTIARMLGLDGSPAPKGPPTIKIHGMVDGHWRLLLMAPADDILSIRMLPVGVEAPE